MYSYKCIDHAFWVRLKLERLLLFTFPSAPTPPPSSMLDKTKVFVHVIVLILSQLIEE